ncbi:hypothetical protein [Actinomadura gamaensis]|uniref:Uncharacterized protein n=1 Tax=Actinomadura gamaensis TaxID=1763541 RepID=A0ABV9U3K2_9ACTN
MSAAPSTEAPATPRRTASADEEQMALSLVTLWAMRTGRTPPPGPYPSLPAAELIDFWADPHMPHPSTPDPRADANRPRHERGDTRGAESARPRS